MKTLKLIWFVALVSLAGCAGVSPDKSSDTILADGQMPNLVKDDDDNVHLVYGVGDSIMYSLSKDGGSSFSSPALISVLPGLAASHTRGPQIAVSENGPVVTACANSGDIFSYQETSEGKWTNGARVNDLDTVAKENLMALAADGNLTYAVWLDLRDKRNKIFGARSDDGGKSWTKNTLIYASPDSTVCECCKPSVAVRGNNVYVMFRNWLGGNRDMYVVHSSDGGVSFNDAQKLGKQSWPLEGCPMDGGRLVLDNNGNPKTVWNRKGTIYSSTLGTEEVNVGQGRNCTLAALNDGSVVYAWVEDGNVVVSTASGKKHVLGKGQLPVLQPVNANTVVCVWEQDKQIHKQVVAL